MAEGLAIPIFLLEGTMILDCPGSEWMVRLGPITCTNQAVSREQAETGARQQVEEMVLGALAKAEELVALLQRGAICSDGGASLVPVKDLPEVRVVIHRLDKGDWFVLASSGHFGYKLACRKA